MPSLRRTLSTEGWSRIWLHRPLHTMYSTAGLSLPALLRNLLLFAPFRFELGPNPRVGKPKTGELCC